MRRSVRCRWCSQSGHNLRGCEAHKKWILENPESSYARRDSQIRLRAKNKKCSYCTETGHNKKTCSTRMNHVIQLQKLNKAYRKYWYNSLCELGIGVGSLVSYNQQINTYDQNRKEYVAVDQPLMFVEEILWKNICITEWTTNYQIKARYTNVVEYYSGLNKTEHLSIQELSDERKGKKVISPVEPYNDELDSWYASGVDRINDYVDSNRSHSVQKFIDYMYGNSDYNHYWTKPPEFNKYLDE